MELDSGVGIILKLLEGLHVDTETLVIFSSDNGAATYAKEKGESVLSPMYPLGMGTDSVSYIYTVTCLCLLTRASAR